MPDYTRLITRLDELGDKLSDIHRELGENSAQHTAMKETLASIEEHAKVTNGRVTSLEKFKIKAVAYITVIGIIVSGLFQVAQLII